jgi:chromosome segregation ATPase
MPKVYCSLSELKNAVEPRDAYIEELEAEKKRLLHYWDLEKRKNQAKRSRLASLRSALQDLQKQNNDIEKQNSELQTQNNDLQTTISRVQSECARYREASMKAQREKDIIDVQLRRVAASASKQMNAIVAQYEERISRLKEIHKREVQMLIADPA